MTPNNVGGMALRVAGAQLNLVVGDIDGNERRILDSMEWAEAESADVLLLPELAISGYPPEDLVLRRDFVDAGLEALARLAAASRSVTTVVGFVDRASRDAPDTGDSVGRNVANAAAVLHGGRLVGVYHKVLLPNYGVFDEDRYFAEGHRPASVWEVAGTTVGISICEDVWSPDGPHRAQAGAGAKALLNINASPFHRGKAAEREEMLADRARASGAPLVYVNLVGGQDELVFDGASVAFDASGTLIHRSPQFEEDRFVVELPMAGETTVAGSVSPLLGPPEEVYRALVVGVRDYVTKNRFERAVVSLSGGIDSALTAAVAVDALGADAVWGITMPTRYSSEHSISDSADLAGNLGIRFDIVPVDAIYSAFLDSLEPIFSDSPFGTAEENLQARARATVLMAVSNKFGPIVLATGNKSEMAVGYATLYGDMVGGYAVLKDVFKTLVWELARWRNKDGEVIPQNTIDKPPSAELRPGQLDSDSLPPYEVLDPILQKFIEDDRSPDEIVADGFDAGVVDRVVAMVGRNEYKRRQAAPGVKITVKAFGKDRRLPITNAYRGATPGAQSGSSASAG